jgi:hypothetical protein
MVLLGKTDFIPAFHPKARRCSKLQLAGLLACSPIVKPSHPPRQIVVWSFNSPQFPRGRRETPISSGQAV